MKRTIRNVDLEVYIGIINHPNSFRNNVNFKISANVDYVLRVNLKMMNDRYEIFREMRDEIQKEFIEAGKVTEDMSRIADEYLGEYNERYLPLAYQTNVFDFQPIKKEDFERPMLSMPERDLLNLMVEGEEIKKVEAEIVE